MLYFKRFIVTVFWVLVIAFLHYTLPQRDVARVVDTEVRRVDFGENSLFWAGADTGQESSSINRDIRFINIQQFNPPLKARMCGGHRFTVRISKCEH